MTKAKADAFEEAIKALERGILRIPSKVNPSAGVALNALRKASVAERKKALQKQIQVIQHVKALLSECGL